MLKANPTGEQVVAGSAGIERAGSTLTVNQGSNKVIINWQDFSIGGGELTKFLQPSSSSAALNRVVGGNLSAIHGTLQSNGKVFLINPNGVVVGADGIVQTGGFVSSTRELSNEAFLAGGDLLFQGNSDATITNLGAISATGGDIFLIADKVENRGTLQALQGTVGMAAGHSILLSEGPEKLFVQPSTTATAVPTNPGESVLNTGFIDAASAELKAAGGNIYALAIRNEGTIRATGSETVNGRVLLKAQGNITNTGTIRARNADGSGGSIELAGGVSMAGPSTISLGGTVDVSAIEASEAALIGKLRGGRIAVTGQQIKVESDARITANGASGGGTILIGGDYQGSNGTVQNAEKTYVSSGAKIEANALQSGDGGKVIVWADEWTQYFGSIEAKGGQNGGDGGFAEVSGKETLIFEGGADLSAAQGKTGTLLLDPTDITIQTTGPTTVPGGGNPFTFQESSAIGSGVISVSSLLSALGSADVEIRTQNALGSGNGDITIVDDIIYNGGANRTLTLVAERNIILGNGVEIIGSAAQLNVNLSADFDLNGVGDITMGSATFINSNFGQITFTASGFVIDSTATINGSTVSFSAANSGVVNISLGGGGGGLELSDAELDTIQTGVLEVHNTTGGDVVLVGNVSLNFLTVGKLFLDITGGNLDDQVSNTLSVKDLEINMGGSGQILMGGVNHDVDFLQVNGSSQLDFRDADDLFLNGLITNGNIRLIAGTDIDQTSLISTSGSLTLDAGGDVSLTVNINDFSSLEVLAAQSVRIQNSRTLGTTLDDVSVTDFFEYDGEGPLLVNGTIQTLGGDVEIFLKGAGNDLTVGSTATITTGDASTEGGNIMVEAEDGEVIVNGGAILSTQGDSVTGGITVQFGSVTMSGSVLLGKGDVVFVGGETVNYWTDGGATGDWNDGGNWSQGASPNSTQDVIISDDVSDTLISISAGSFARNMYSDVNLEINAGGSLSLGGFARFESDMNLIEGDLLLAGNTSVGGLLTLGNSTTAGNLGGAGNLGVNNVTWTNGSISLTGVMAIAGNLDVLDTAVKTISGTAVFSEGSADLAGTVLYLDDGATLVNTNTGIMTIQDDLDILNSNTSTGFFVNQGSLTKQGAGTATGFASEITVSNEAGAFFQVVAGNVGMGNLLNDGDVQVDSGASLTFYGSGNYQFNAGSTLGGGGTLFVNDGNLSIDTTGTGDFVVGIYNQSGGAVSGTGILEATADFIHSGGTLGTLGSFDLTKATGNFLLNDLTAIDDIFITALTGAIVDNNGAALNLSADNIYLQAATGVGSTDAIETAAADMEVVNTGAGNIRIANAFGSGTTLTNLVNSATGGLIDFSQVTGSLTLTGSAVTGNTADISLSSNAALDVSGALISTGSADGFGSFSNNGATLTGATITAGTGTFITLNSAASMDVIINSALIQAAAINLTATRDIVINNLVQTSSGAFDITITADTDNNGSGGVLITSAGAVDSSQNVTITGSSFTNLGSSGSFGFANGFAVYVQNDGTNNQIQAQGNIVIEGNSAAPGANIKLLGNTESFGGGLLVQPQNRLELAGQHIAGGGAMEFTGETVLVGLTDLDVDDENLVFYNTVDGAFQLNISTGSGDVIFWEDGGGTVALTGLEITDSGSVYFDNGFHATNLFVNSNGAISAFDTLTAVDGGFTSTGGDIDLNVGAHQIGAVSFSAPGQTVNYAGAGTYTVAAAEASTLNLTSNSGDIIDGGDWNVANLSLTATNGTAFLFIDDDGSSPVTANYATQALDITTAFSYGFGNLIYAGNLTLHAGGTVTQGAPVNIGGSFVVDAVGQTVDLGTFANNVGSFRADAASVNLQTSGPLILSGGTYDNLSLDVNGNVSQSAALTVNNSLAINSQGSITLTNNGNKITSLATVSAVTTINIFEDPGFTINGPVTAGGDITLGTNGGDLTLNGSVLSLGGGFVRVYTNLGFNVINNAGAGVFGTGDFAVYTTSDAFLGGLIFDQTINAPAFPAAGAVPGQTTLVLLGVGTNPPTLADVDNNPPINEPSATGDIVTGDDDQGAGALEGGGIIQTAYAEEEGGDYMDNGDGVIGLDGFGNSQRITDARIIILLKEALDDKAQQDLLTAIGITLEEFNAAAGGNLVTPGEVFDMSDLSSGSLATAPKTLQEALSDKAKAELEAILEQIMDLQGDLDGVTVFVGQAFDIATGQRLPDVPPVLVISLSSLARLELDRAMQ